MIKFIVCHAIIIKQETEAGRFKFYSPGIFACKDAPFIYATPQYIQTSPENALLFTFNVTEIPEIIPITVKTEVSYQAVDTRWLYPFLYFAMVIFLLLDRLENIYFCRYFVL